MDTIKKPTDSYIYNKVITSTQANIIQFITTATRINKADPAFKPVVDEVKRRQVSSHLIDVLRSEDVILCVSDKPITQSFTICYVKDIKGTKKPRLFIDLSTTIVNRNGYWETTNINALIAHLIHASTRLIYNKYPNRIISNSTLNIVGTANFIAIFTYVLDYLRISGYLVHKTKIAYLTGLYYQCGVLRKPLSDLAKNIAIRASKIERSDAELLDKIITEDTFTDINTYIQFLVNTFRFKDLTVGTYIEKWMYLFAPGTQYGMELFPDFAAMITNVYAGTYINNAKQIEKCIGKGGLQTFGAEILSIGKNTFSRNR